MQTLCPGRAGDCRSAGPTLPRRVLVSGTCDGNSWRSSLVLCTAGVEGAPAFEGTDERPVVRSLAVVWVQHQDHVHVVCWLVSDLGGTAIV